MSYQTSLNGSGGSRRPPVSDDGRGVVGNAAGVMHDIAELLELQAKLLVADSKAVARRAALPAVLFSIGLVALLGCTPVALTTLAELLVATLDWSRPFSLLAATVCGVICSVGLLVAGWWHSRHVFDELGNSREEFARNVSWIKQSLKSGGGISHEQSNRVA